MATPNATPNESVDSTLPANVIEALQIRLEQVRLLYKPVLLAAIATAVAAVMLAVIQWPIVDHATILIWLTCIGLIVLGRIISFFRFKRINPGIFEAKPWEHFHIAMAIGAGLAWGSAGFFLFPGGAPEYQAATIIILAGMAAGAVTTFSALRGPIFTFLPLIMIPVTLNLLLEQTATSVSIAFMCFVYIAFLAKSAAQTYLSHLENISLRIEAVNSEKQLAKAEQKTRLNEARLAQTQRIAHLGGWEWDVKTGEVYWSDEIYRILGLQPGEIKPDYGTLISFVHPDDREMLQSAVRKALKEGSSYSVGCRITRADGSEGFINAEGSVIFNEQGEAIYMSGIDHDITQHKKLEDQLLHSQKMEAIGTLVGGIAHDFNNTLAAMQGNLYLAKHKMDQREVVAAKLDNIEKLGNRAAEMVQQLLTFARKDMRSMQALSFTLFMDEALKLSKTVIPENIEHVCHLCRETLPIEGDASQLQQVVINLLNNARDALQDRENPRITCTVEPFHADHEFLQNHPELKGKHFSHLIIEDNGCGMTAQQVAHIYEPFFTTKEVGKGTGLGLSMAYGAIQSHGGAIEVDSKPGVGTTFHIYLPLTHSSEVMVDTFRGEVETGRGETILLADDESDMLEATCEVLRSLGYKVITAADGEEAVELFKQHAADIGVVITDIVMPKMGGVEAVKQMRLLNVHLPVIFATGYDKDQAIASTQGLTHCITISKPFSFEKLSRTLRNLIKPGSVEAAADETSPKPD